LCWCRVCQLRTTHRPIRPAPPVSNGSLQRRTHLVFLEHSANRSEFLLLSVSIVVLPLLVEPVYRCGIDVGCRADAAGAASSHGSQQKGFASREYVEPMVRKLP